MALNEGATKLVNGQRWKVKNGKWVKVSNSKARQTTTGSNGRTARQNASNARVTKGGEGIKGLSSNRTTVGGRSNGPKPSDSRTAPSVPKPKTTPKGTTPKTTVKGAAKAGLLGRAGAVAGPIIAGQQVAGYMAENSRQGVSTSGRGSGRAAFRDGNKNANRLQPKPTDNKNKDSKDSSSFRSRMGMNGEPRLNPGHPSNRTPKSSTKEGARTIKSSSAKYATAVPGSTQPSSKDNNNGRSNRTGNGGGNGGGGGGGGGRKGGSGGGTKRTPQSSDMNANYKDWAKANPKLAAKLKPGQAGYKAIHGSSAPAKSNQPANAGAGNGAPGAQRRSSLNTTTAAQKAAKKVTAAVKDKKKKKKQSAANAAGWKGNRNY